MALLPLAVAVVGLATKVVVTPLTLPGTKFTVAVLWKLATLAVTFSVCAKVEARVAVNVPVASVFPEAGVKVLLPPLKLKDTVWLGTGFPLTSRTTTVNVDVLAPSAVTVLGLATNEVVVLTGAPAKKVTVVCSAVPSTVAVTVFTAACVDLSVVVNTPEALVDPVAGKKVLLPPVALITTGALCTGALLSFNTVIVMVVKALPSAVSALGLATIVELETLTAGVVKVTLAFAVTVPTTCAETTSDCTVVDDRVAEKTPEASVLPDGGVKELFVPVPESTTDCPETGLPWASKAVVTNVVRVLPSAASVLGFATKVVVVALTGPGLNVTFVVAVAEPAVPVMVFVSAFVDDNEATN